MGLTSTTRTYYEIRGIVTHKHKRSLMIWEDITLDVAIVFHSFCSTVSRHMMKETFVLPGSKILTKSWAKSRFSIAKKLGIWRNFIRISPIFQRMVWRLQGSSHHEVTPKGHEGPWRSAIENLRCKEMKIMKPRVTCCNIWNNHVTSLIIYNHMRILWGCVVHIRYIYIWYIYI